MSMLKEICYVLEHAYMYDVLGDIFQDVCPASWLLRWGNFPQVEVGHGCDIVVLHLSQRCWHKCLLQLNISILKQKFI